MAFDAMTLQEGTGRLKFPGFDKACQAAYPNYTEWAKMLGIAIDEKGRQRNGEVPALCPCGHEHTTKAQKFSFNEIKKNFHCFYSGCELSGCMWVELAAAAWYGDTSVGSQRSAMARIANDFPAVLEEWEKYHAKNGKRTQGPAKILPKQAADAFMVKAMAASKDSKEFKAFLEGERGIPVVPTARRLEIGMSLPNTAKQLNIEDEELLKRAGILGTAGSGNTYFPFKGRVIARVSDTAFYGRALNPDEKRKHLYSAGASNFQPWGLNRAREIATRKGIEKLFIVESILDAASVEAFIDATFQKEWVALATLGTMGVKLEALVAFCKELKPAEVVIIPDCDPWRKEDGRVHAPGQQTGMKRADALQAAGLAVRVMPLPNGADPNDMTAPKKLNWSAVKFLSVLDRALSPLQYRLWCSAHYFDLKTEGGRQGFLNRALKTIQVGYTGKELPTELASFVGKVGNFGEKATDEIYAALLTEMSKRSQVIAKAYARKWAKVMLKNGKAKEEILAELFKE